ncbi:MAG: hypothetical protein WKF43_06335 [Acidimicrobiales bacterium]
MYPTGDERARLEAQRARSQAEDGTLTERHHASERARRVARPSSTGPRSSVARRKASTTRCARAEALALALDQARARAGAERLVGIDGIVGTLLDVVEIDPGWEAAFEAAAGEAIAAVVVADGASGRRALETLRAVGTAGAVLPLRGRADKRGLHQAQPHVAAQPHRFRARRVDLSAGPVSTGAGDGAGRTTMGSHLASGADAVRPHVHSDSPAVAALLDRLDGAGRVVDGWPAALDIVLSDPMPWW